MNYKLAKQLKDAGFPQYESDYFFANHEERGLEVEQVDSATGEHLADFPSLSQLIKSCGDEFVELQRVPNTETGVTWCAIAGNGVFRVGSTPKESVANLWLELNKK